MFSQTTKDLSRRQLTGLQNPLRPSKGKELSKQPVPDQPFSNPNGPTKRETPRYNGLYAKGSVQNVKVYFTIDTGAATTLLSTSLFDKIPKGQRPSLEPTRPLSTASGEPLKTLGRGTFKIQIGPLTVERQMTVAAITDDYPKPPKRAC